MVPRFPDPIRSSARSRVALGIAWVLLVAGCSPAPKPSIQGNRRELCALPPAEVRAEGEGGAVVGEPDRALSEADGTWRLAPGTAVRWPLELAGPARLELACDARVRGRVRVALERVDRRTGARERALALELEVGPRAPVHRRLELPGPDGRALDLWVAWSPVGEAGPLRLHSLELEESRPLARPRVLFLSVDTLAAANLSAYGYERPTSPHLEGLARDGIRFDRARANASWTVPSYASQFTGLYAHSNRAPAPEPWHPVEAWETFLVSERRWTLAEMMKGAGYRTAAFVDNLWIARIQGFDQGFDVFDDEAAERPIGDADGGMRIVFPRALEYLVEHRAEPVFVFAQVLDVHGPYQAGRGYRGRFSSELGEREPRHYPVVPSTPPVWGGVPDSIARGRFGRHAELPDRVDAESFRAAYDETVLELDAELGRLLEGLKREGLYDDLLIVLSADHGESMLDHEFLFQHGLLYDSALHVPLVVKLPGQAQAGRVVRTPVQLVDLYPTLAELIGLPADPLGLHGRSLVPALEGATLEDVPLLGQAAVFDQTAIVLGRWKLLVGRPEAAAVGTLATHPTIQERLHARRGPDFERLFGGAPPVDPNRVLDVIGALERDDPETLRRLKRDVRAVGPILELYDVEADPGERHDLAEREPEVLRRLLERLDAETARMRSATLDEQAPATELDEAALEELRRLGYLGDG